MAPIRQRELLVHSGLVRLVLNEELRTAVVGSAAGLLVAAATTHLMVDLLLQAFPRDAAVVAAEGVVAVAVIARLSPALRAFRVNRAEALRAE